MKVARVQRVGHDHRVTSKDGGGIKPPHKELSLDEMARSDDPVIKAQYLRIKARLDELARETGV